MSSSAAAAAVNRPPPAHPGPNTESHPSYNSRVPNLGLHDPGLHGPQDLGPHVSARPIMCVPVPPPPPFLHYQWPTPFSYNPFTGFPGLGYGMVLPPFPPPAPYMEPPAYVMPHPQFQPVDFRRLLHPSVPVPSAPQQHPNQPRRVRPPHTAPVRETVNSGVQTDPPQRDPGAPGEVGPLITSDSGHGTMSPSSSRSSSRSSSHRQGQAEAETGSKDFQVTTSCSGPTVTQGFHILHPSGAKAVQSWSRKTSQRQRVQEMVPVHRDGPCTMWSVDSPDDVVPVCSSSQQEDEAVKERRVSVPDILMSWAGASPQEVMQQKSKVLPKKEQQLLPPEEETDESEHQSPAEDSPVEADGAADDDDDDDAQGNLSLKDTDPLCKIIRLPLTLQELLSESIRESRPSAALEQASRDDLLRSFEQLQRLLHHEPDSETNPQADTSQVTAHQMFVESFQTKRKMNESIWSVESLAPFIPNKESLQQSGVFEPEGIAETAEPDENHGPGTFHDSSVVKASKERRRSLRFSSSDSVLMSDNLMVFSTPAVEQSRSQKQTLENEPEASERRESVKGQSTTPSEKAALASPPPLQARIILSPPTREEPDGPRSSEPEAPQSPNQDSLTLPEPKEKSPSSSEQEGTLLMNSAEEEKSSRPCGRLHKDAEDRKLHHGAGENAEVGNVELSVPAAHQTTAVSPTRGNLVDCGVQCGVMEEHQCVCEKSSSGPNRRHHLKSSDVRDSDHRAEGHWTNAQNPKNQKRNAQWKHRGQGKQNGQTDAYNGFSGKAGRCGGGNGRNHRY